MSKHVNRVPERLDSFYEVLHDYHKNYFPHLRFGQLMMNFLIYLKNYKDIEDVYYIEDERFLKLFGEFVIYLCRR